jgi:hypothetical protein
MFTNEELLTILIQLESKSKLKESKVIKEICRKINKYFEEESKNV